MIKTSTQQQATTVRKEALSLREQKEKYMEECGGRRRKERADMAIL